MLNAQKEVYGDGLDKNYLHPYMWAWKPHYYDANYNYYNFLCFWTFTCKRIIC